jgi:hypothetical protein
MNLRNVWHIDNSTASFPDLKTFLIQPIFCRYFKMISVTNLSAEMTEGYFDTFLSFQIFDYEEQVFIFRNLIFLISGKVIGQGKINILLTVHHTLSV